MAAASWGDDALDALRRMFSEVDAGRNVDEVLGDDVRDMTDFSRMIGFGRGRQAPTPMTPREQAAWDQANAAQRKRAEEERIRQMLMGIQEQEDELLAEEEALRRLRELFGDDLP